jgi:hypothetical protein
MSFYLTLPSTASLQYYPDNTQSNYTTILKQPITLASDYEVALSEITFSPNMKVDLGTISFDDPYKNSLEPVCNVPLSALNGSKSHDFFNSLNTIIKTYLIKKEYTHRFNVAFLPTALMAQKFSAYNIQQLTVRTGRITVYKKSITYEVLDTGDGPVADILLRNDGTFLPDQFKFSFTSIDKLQKQTGVDLVYVPFSEVDYFDHKPQNLVNFSDDKFMNDIHRDIVQFFDKQIKVTIPYFELPDLNTLKFTTVNPFEFDGLVSVFLTELYRKKINESGQLTLKSQVLNLINYAALYTDLIEDQYFGDTLAPILRIINIKSQSSADTITFFDNPHYVNINKSNISSINIKICDLKGNQIQFENIFAFVILKLHFRKR